MGNEVRVRYAPSPTGHLHIGNARTALFNYLFARSQGGKFIIRIEDTDRKRNIEGGEQSQLNYLKWLGIDWDESVDVGGEYGPYRQSERNDIYKTYYEELLEKGLAYKCYCTEEELEKEREEQAARGEMPRYSGKCRNLTKEEQEKLEAEGRQPSIRFKVPQGEVIRFDDIVKGEISFETDGIGDFVIVKKDGTPTYNFAVAVDDYLMKMTHVLRGEDHISNTPKQIMIYNALGWDIPAFGHMTLIVNESRKKLSKRDESIIQFIEQYEELGYLPEALFNFITLLGWSPVGEEELFTKEQFIEIFDVNRLSKSPAVFDTHKLKWVNNQYVKKLDLDQVIELTVPHLQKAGKVSEELSGSEQEWVRKLISLYQEQLSYGAEIVELTELFFKDDIQYNREARTVLEEEQVPEVLRVFAEKLEQLDSFTADEIKASIKAVQKETGHKGKKLFMPIRVATTGQTHGPELPQSIELLGKDTVLKRLHNIIQ
ncbi:glutamate--tRNA ligase [Bacillus sp. GM2]|jgi:nondiscriminating glutamyl-tRNA synthetase|uniref:Glutamate--tRNA ligase n=1 Tax=Bacillus licheniformis (strain ATCC 14580 / DSM 13 / JCM 2505 / CCUG 7422 / NBRC 12200 / NCIMB 9375 / NCTC 10341 / NRRL NRS-1264 / Gibson 46) TaxID=279010 RepID=SYE_BACLD|nr:MULTISPECIES: glutamate--tRNA ligase [Bacillus]Q65PD0.1 RecName: Full=Glutamate--tRNA ligase; AltName: Full=Glutamyl-tRNA synthetase; Short=GluRS [Bacillus licheniformis DSM 13 = ATCC 14580]AAU21740.1 glutamyl-tRNA synthetase [Bacillus licheniformis DSM 13 = ATCC 14580]AAU39084.1 glutamyl-tRNA ligase GltX [Bacillus licheniformis DSM 13 = ATCC 14580]ARC70505.1 glutamate--tRNA ligase [Bacillus licheniformis]ARC76073.1 glutamate--tRNA ligase [Bacillus licheniformis]ARW45231.1 Glutamate--tRNA(